MFFTERYQVSLLTLLYKGIDVQQSETAEAHNRLMKSVMSIFRMSFKGSMRLRCVQMAIPLRNFDNPNPEDT